jgi:hypothetical protein
VRRAVATPSDVRSRGARPTSADSRELVAPSITRVIARWIRYRAARASTTIRVMWSVVETMASAEVARKSLLVHS